jgi:exodeoxyribonuclease V gamma subunit
MLSIHVSDRLDELVDDLAARLAADPLPPHQDECLVVQSLSLRRWLQQQLASRLGISAGLDLPFPAGLIGSLEGAFGLAAPEDDPWHRDRLRWRIAALADRADGALAPLARYLATGHPAARPAKRLQLADRIADLLDAYQIYRPEMLAAWEDGQGWSGFAEKPEAQAHEGWQAELWRRLRAQIAVAPRSRRLDELVRRLRAEGPPRGWRLRVGVLSTGVLPPRVVDVLEALAEHLPVTIWLVSPLPQPWGDVTSQREAARRGVEAQGHPLVASLGRQARDWFRAIGERPAWEAGWRWIAGPRPAPTTLLARIQAELGERASGPAGPFDPADVSLVFDCCHGPRREVEVARDRILAACAELPGLRPHDILVLAPDLGVYGPLVEAVFGAADPAIRLPVRIADRSLGEDDPVAEGLLAILALAQGRCGLGEVLDLLELPALRAAAGLAPEQIPRAHDALERAGLRWGRDARHRGELLGGATGEDHGTLAAAIDRLALGWAMGGDAAWGRPASAADGAPDHELVGVLLAWLQRLNATLAALATPRDLTRWSADLAGVISGLLAAPDADTTTAREAVEGLATDAAVLPAGFTVSLSEVAAALDTLLAVEARASDFVSGSITLAGLKPMRMIPARVIVLLGMDDASWPRRSVTQPFDLLAARPRPGDRQPREDDRQLFLEAILAAGERLIITWAGRAAQGDPRHERPPSACLAELFDAVDAAVAWEGDDALRPSRRLTTVHPLQPFAATYLAIGGRPAVPSWDAAALALARRLAIPVARRPAEPVFADALTPAGDWEIDLDELVRVWSDPAAAWCRARLAAVPRAHDAEATEDEPFQLDHLERYRLIDDLLADAPAEPLLERAAADGRLPLGHLGAAERVRLVRETADLRAVLAAHRRAEPLAITVTGPGWRLDGLLDPPPVGGVLRLVHAGARISERVRLALAIRLLAWNAWQHARGEAPGRGEAVARDGRESFAPHDGAAASRLGELLQLTRRALAEPLPFFPRTAWKLHEKRDQPPEALLAIAQGPPWNVDYGDRSGESELPAVQLAWRGRQPITPDAVALMLRVWELLLPPPPAVPAAAKPTRKRSKS